MSSVPVVADEATTLEKRVPALKTSFCPCSAHHHADNVVPIREKTLLEMREEAERNPLGTYCPTCPCPYDYWGP